MTDYAKDIARASLSIGGIKLQPDDPFTWASGYRMPIYNDNRMLLADPEHRLLVAIAFKEMIMENMIPHHYIVGTSTAGIAPATSIASLLQAPIAIIDEGRAYELPVKFGELSLKGIDAVASTCPWGIAEGVSLANKTRLPFMYVRQSKKKHGLQQQIEGIPKEGQKVLLIDYHTGTSYKDNAISALKEKGVEVFEVFDEDISGTINPADISGKKISVVEDLISTGGSSVEEVIACRNLGAEVKFCLSIFNYGLDKAMDQFKEAECNVLSVLTYDTLLEVAKETGYINEEQAKLLEEWRSDPFGWGAKHGFPKVDKR